jgi:hypothetical protein
MFIADMVHCANLRCNDSGLRGLVDCRKERGDQVVRGIADVDQRAPVEDRVAFSP